MEDKEKLIDKIDERRAELLKEICEGEKVYIPEIIFQMVIEIRSITKIIKFLRGENEN